MSFGNEQLMSLNCESKYSVTKFIGIFVNNETTSLTLNFPYFVKDYFSLSN